MIDASKSIEDLHEEIKTICKDIISETGSEELTTLWPKQSAVVPGGKRPCPEGAISNDNGKEASSPAGGDQVNGTGKETPV